MNLKLYAIVLAVGLGIGGATGWKLHKAPPPAKTETVDKDKASSKTTGPVHAEVLEYSSCPPCPSCGGPTAPMPTPRPVAPRASQGIPGPSVSVPASLQALLDVSRAEPEVTLWSNLPPAEGQPMLIRRTILDQGATVEQSKSSVDTKTVETPPPLPKWLVGFEVVDPFTDRSYNVRGGHRVFDTPFFLTGSKAIGTKDWSVGAEVHF
jgi:hypothetical protein